MTRPVDATPRYDPPVGAASREVDYLVVGAGAAGMAFTDALVQESDATVLMVDRRHGPGGHWNDAYPFVQLHQPSAFYGVNSTNLGDDRIDDSGPNAGFYERATGAEVCHYFQAVLRDRLEPTHRVELRSMTDCTHGANGAVQLVCRLTGAREAVTVRRKVVDARFLESSIPATHTPSFAVDDGARCVPVNDLVRVDTPADGYVVIGGGKTAMDACSFLLDQGVDPGSVTWIRPRDAWVLDRATWQPRTMVGRFMISWSESVEAAASATSVDDLFGRLEECGHLWRLDPATAPTMYRAAILSDAERQQLQSIERVVRQGRVRRVGTDRVVLEEGEIPASPRTLHVDCTADGLPAPPSRPIFEARRVTIQQMRETSPTFNAALIGYLEATRGDAVEDANRLAPPVPYPNAALDWIRVRHVGMVAQSRWDQEVDVRAWVDSSRLSISAGLMDHATEPGVGPAMMSYLEHAPRARARLAGLRTELGDDVTDLA
jgi:cation diffusion facilitator CzcD-associated flavoprotein CzcO